jgi:hypothetical protein
VLNGDAGSMEPGALEGIPRLQHLQLAHITPTGEEEGNDPAVRVAAQQAMAAEARLEEGAQSTETDCRAAPAAGGAAGGT